MLLRRARGLAQELRRDVRAHLEQTVSTTQLLKDYSAEALPSMLRSRQHLRRLTQDKCQWLALPRAVPTLTSYSTPVHSCQHSVNAQAVQALAQRWEQRHEGVRAAPRVAVRNPVFSHCCWNACICAGEPNHIWMKVKAALRGTSQTQLQSGHLVLKWQSFFLDDEETLSLAGTVGHGVPGCGYYTHLSFHMASPFRLVLVEMEAVDGDEVLQTKPGDRHRLHACIDHGSPKVFLLQEWIGRLDYSLAWDVSLLELSSRCMPVATIATQTVTVLDSEARVWPGALAAEKQKKRRPIHELLARPPRGPGSTSTQPVSQSAESSAVGAANLPVAESDDGEGGVSADSEDDAKSLLQELADVSLAGPRASSTTINETSGSSSSSDSDVEIHFEASNEVETQFEPSTAQEAAAPQAAEPQEVAEAGEAVQAHDARRAHDKLLMRRADSTQQPYGFLKVNPSLNNMFAQCWLHADCVRTKTLNRTGRRGRGRPVGMLGAWLAGQATCATKVEHMKFQPSREQRCQAREQLRREPNAAPFFAAEHAKNLHSDSEPSR